MQVPLRRLFALSSVAFLAVLAFSPVKNALRPYRAIQNQFRQLGISRATTLKAAQTYTARPIAIQQIWLPDLDNRVDRCTTCHLGVADDAMAGAPEPFSRHPETVHTPRDFAKFGCTSCHGGEGLATSDDDAHGTTADSTSPIVPAAYAEAGCGRCHQSDFIADAPILSKGRALMEKSGCYACHAARGHEDFRSDAPPLDTIAVKTGGEWLHGWLTNPKGVDPNATMPNFRLSRQEIDEISNYLFGRAVPPQLRQAIDAAAAEPPGNSAHGKTLFALS